MLQVSRDSSLKIPKQIEVYEKSSNSVDDTVAVKKAINYLDVGGLIVTITRLFSDVRFITKVKEEFIDSKIDEQNKKLIEMLDADLARFE